LAELASIKAQLVYARKTQEAEMNTSYELLVIDELAYQLTNFSFRTM